MHQETKMLRQEVILLPETDRIVLSEEVISKLPVGGSIRSRSQKEGEKGLILKKEEGGLVVIESKRDTMRIEQRTSFETNETHAIEEVKRRQPYYLYVGVILMLIIIGKVFSK